MTTRWRWSPRRKWAPAAWPTRSAVSAVIGSLLVRPRIPSVPKNLRVIGGALARLADPAPEACGHPAQCSVSPGCDKEEQCAADQGHDTGVRRTSGEWYECGSRGPFVEALPQLLGFLAVLPRRAAEREDEDRAVEHQRLGRADDNEVDDRPDGKAPHHRMSGDAEHALRPRHAVEPRAGKHRIAHEGADEKDRAEPHEHGREQPDRIARDPERRLIADRRVEIDHEPQGHERQQRVDAAERGFPEPADE